MSKNEPQQWTPEEEEQIDFFMGLIPLLAEVKKDLESKFKHLPDFSLPPDFYKNLKND